MGPVLITYTAKQRICKRARDQNHKTAIASPVGLIHAVIVRSRKCRRPTVQVVQTPRLRPNKLEAPQIDTMAGSNADDVTPSPGPDVHSNPIL